MKLVIGPEKFEEGRCDIAVLGADDNKVTFNLDEFSSLQEGKTPEWTYQVDEIIVGFSNASNLEYLQYFPKCKSVRIMTSQVTDISGLLYLSMLKSLTIERARCRMHILGELESLEEIFLDDWRLGADSLFNLTKIVKASLHKYGCNNLESIRKWSLLNELWIRAGKLNELYGIPEGVQALRLTSIRKLESLTPLSQCTKLESLIVESCRGIMSLDGLEYCTNLKTLSLPQMGKLDHLYSLRSLKNLEYLFLADGTDATNGIEVLYELPKLTTLVVSKKSGIDAEVFSNGHPDCKLVLTS